MTVLSVYGTTLAATTVTTANKLANSTGGTLANTTTKVAKLTGFIEMWSQGNATATTFGSIQAPTGQGWLWDVTTLEGQQIATGVWTPSVWLATSASVITADVIMRA